MCDNKIIWDELVKSDYLLEMIEITIGTKLLEINVIFDNFDDLDKFTNYISNKYYYSMNNVEPSNNSLLINLFHKTIDIFEMLNYPPNVNIIKIMVENDDEMTNFIKSPFYQIKLLNLPTNLIQLKIISKYSFNLSNLPTQLILLDLSESSCKFNLDYLPDSVQILYLPTLPMFKKIFKYIYELKDLINLPSSLNKIYIGKNRNIVYNSAKELIENYNNDLTMI